MTPIAAGLLYGRETNETVYMANVCLVASCFEVVFLGVVGFWMLLTVAVASPASAELPWLWIPPCIGVPK
jgi:hypothetical protein